MHLNVFWQTPSWPYRNTIPFHCHCMKEEVQCKLFFGTSDGSNWDICGRSVEAFFLFSSKISRLSTYECRNLCVRRHSACFETVDRTQCSIEALSQHYTFLWSCCDGVGRTYSPLYCDFFICPKKGSLAQFCNQLCSNVGEQLLSVKASNDFSVQTPFMCSWWNYSNAMNWRKMENQGE